MAFLRFSRDKRGYEYFYLVQPNNRGKGRPRVLYWFRTPPNVKVGRSPFDPDVRRALEAQNPDVVFDWEAIVHTPIPPPIEPERWRERRRVERALRAAETEEAAAIADAGQFSSQGDTPAPLNQELEEQPVDESPAIEGESPAGEAGEVGETAKPIATSNLSSAAPPEGGGAPRQGRRRRRRRGRRKPQQVQGSGFQAPGSGFQPQGSQAETSQSQEVAAEDSGEPTDEEPEP